MRRINSLIAIAALLLAFAGTTVVAQTATYPDKQVTLVVGYAPGGATDRVARLMAKVLTEQTKQTFIVENKPGANSNIAAEQVSRSKPDGYTLMVGSIANTINRSLYAKLNYDLVKDFTMVGMLASVPNVLVVNPNVPAKTVGEYIAYAKANPGKLTFASSGAGAPQRLAMEMFRYQLGLDLLHVPYKGSGPAMTDLVGGQVLTMSETVPAALQFIQAGQLRALAVTTSKRISQLPDVPTITEATGLPNFDVVSMFGILAPAGTPKPIIDKLSADIKVILQRPEVQERMLAAGVYVNFLSPADSAKRIQRELAMWGKVVKDANIKAD